MDKASLANLRPTWAPTVRVPDGCQRLDRQVASHQAVLRKSVNSAVPPAAWVVATAEEAAASVEPVVASAEEAAAVGEAAAGGDDRSLKLW